MPVIAEMINTAYQQPVEALLVAGARDGSLVAQPDPRSASMALFGAVTHYGDVAGGEDAGHPAGEPCR